VFVRPTQYLVVQTEAERNMETTTANNYVNVFTPNIMYLLSKGRDIVQIKESFTCDLGSLVHFLRLQYLHRK